VTAPSQGGCACGAVRYECSEPSIVDLLCHCADCQKASGSAFAAVAIVATDRLVFTGEPRFYAVRAESGRTMERGFCAACGSPVSIRRPETPAVTFLPAASLDDSSTFSPSAEVWVSRAEAWHSLHPGTLKFEEGPSAEAVRAPIEAYFAARAGNGSR
jgi:hypothetical protein